MLIKRTVKRYEETQHIKDIPRSSRLISKGTPGVVNEVKARINFPKISMDFYIGATTMTEITLGCIPTN
uniref:Uncharacterized protein n=1 Tax=Lepeophtheirus salmonis TaxID=72036 RepID=A0A0K2UYU4_LEPSM